MVTLVDLATLNFRPTANRDPRRLRLDAYIARRDVEAVNSVRLSAPQRLEVRLNRIQLEPDVKPDPESDVGE